METQSTYDKSVARETLYQCYLHDPAVKHSAGRLYRIARDSIQLLRSENPAFDYDFTSHCVLHCGEGSKLVGDLRRQGWAIRDMLVTCASKFACEALRSKPESQQMVNTYVMNKLLKNTKHFIPHSYIYNGDDALHSGRFFSFLHKIEKGGFLSLRDKGARHAARAAEEEGFEGRFPVVLKWRPSRMSGELFDEIVINRQSFVIFKDPLQKNALYLDLPSSTVIVLSPVKISWKGALRVKRIILLQACLSVPSQKWSEVHVITQITNFVFGAIPKENEKLVSIPYASSFEKCSLEFTTPFYDALNENRLQDVVRTVFSLAEFIMSRMPVKVLRNHLALSNSIKRGTIDQEIQNSYYFHAKFLDIPAVTYRWNVSGNVVDPAGMPGVALEESDESEFEPLDGAVLLESLGSIDRAGGGEPAAVPDQGANEEPVEADEE